MTSFLLPGRY